jgi:hypothetical protein
MQYNLKKAAENGDVHTWYYSFMNVMTGMPTNIQVTGVSLACNEYGNKDTQCEEYIFYLDNGQFCHMFRDIKNKNGRYHIADTLDSLGEMHFFLKEKAMETIEYRL